MAMVMSSLLIAESLSFLVRLLANDVVYQHPLVMSKWICEETRCHVGRSEEVLS